MKLAKKNHPETTKTSAKIAENIKSPEQRYGYGLGHFVKFKQRYVRPSEKEQNQSFELGYN